MIYAADTSTSVEKTRAELEAAQKEWEQSCRSAWRCLFLAVKAKLVAVEAQITTFEQEFMAHIVLPNGRTTGEEILPQIDEAYRSGKMPTFTLAPPAPQQ